ncbi:MAG TPA: DegT/DnrJ/EryC1/StrS family aminotransferase [Candidatus Dormibacteraeota bacterium]|nr:DegT/DnrJ/EryC1/StrS family aminotransferase [Candidatus Dormibacteraeota bacterium]
MTTMIPIARPQLGPAEEAAVLEVMRSGILAQGPRVKAFEDAFAQTVGARFAVATSNGTTALYLALRASGVGPGDEVITTPLTFIATANAIMQLGARPVFVDVDDSLNLDPVLAEAAITPRTRAIVPVHLHGNLADLDAFTALAQEHGVALVQDACQAVGARIGGRPLGAFGTAAYSFYATKNLTTGEGGMVISNDPEVARVCRSLRHQAYGVEPYLHDTVAFNYRMTEIQAAIGLAQLQRLEEMTNQRRETARFYGEGIAANGFVRPAVMEDATHVYHQYTLRVAAGSRHTRDVVRARLNESGVSTGVYYPIPVHRQPAYREFAGVHCPVAEQAASDMFSIPVHSGLSRHERERVVEAVNAATAQR